MALIFTKLISTELWIGGDTELKGADFTNASGHALKIANATAWGIRIDGADLRERVSCVMNRARCFGNGVDFAGMTGADLRGATIDHLWDAPPSLGAARLDR